MLRGGTMKVLPSFVSEYSTATDFDRVTSLDISRALPFGRDRLFPRLRFGSNPGQVRTRVTFRAGCVEAMESQRKGWITQRGWASR
jgi:hypothetical protein